LVNFIPRLLYTWEKNPVPTEQEDARAPGTVWTFGEEKNL